MDDLQRINQVDWSALAGAKTESGRDEEEFPSHKTVHCWRCEKDFTYEVEYERGHRYVFEKSSPNACPECEKVDKRESDYTNYGLIYEHLSQLGTRLASVALADFLEEAHNAEALRTARRWLDEKSVPNLIVTGPIGAGKSYLAACVHNALHARHDFALWLNALALKGIDAGETRELAGRVPILVIDDLGKVHPGKDISWTEECFYTVLEARYREELPTIVTTEWKSTALAERVGQSVVSRIEHGALVAGIKKPTKPYRETVR